MTTMNTTLAQPRSYIAGEWVQCETLDAWNVDPNTGEPVHAMVTTSSDDLERALQLAVEVYDASDFLDDDVRLQRAEVLERAATNVEERIEEIARIDALTSGTAIGATRTVASFLPYRLRAAAAEARTIARVTPLAADGRDVRLHRIPWGPAAILTPWNGPSFIPAAKVASALAAGCPVILKPSEHAPASAQAIVECFVDAGLPDGALQFVHGTGEIGAALTGDRRVQVVSFTGGPGAGRAIARAAAEDFKVLQLELGGNNPALVLDDADLDVTADGLLTGMTNLNGQWCEGPGKVFAPHRLVEPLREALNARIAKLRIGHSLDETTDIGPISNAPHFRTLLQRIDGLRELGAEIDQVGELPDLGGFFLSPTVATGSDPDRTTAELFGPVISLHGVDSDGEALRLANANPSGLDAYVFGTDTDHAIAIGSRVRSGEVRVNGAKVADLGADSAQSFWGPSGIGGHGPAESVRVFCGDRVVGVDSPDLPM
ncbi:aldehyde dehydrogenase [Gordonia spumicola]|uniref:Aldehyde dehydrogenase n=1 Tax=Gordonia spumicola TaxID=589161 RepID=A0A7I9V6S7_9ACTN|nr:aldehyde dehydrogenase family protein [Gordonia spumicola]GEE00934.1 aldehyde dehydrogenase [Gordonia spumicola]